MQVNQDWDIKPRGVACVMCQECFGDKQVYVSLLALSAEGYVRRDYCETCWANVAAAVVTGFSAPAEGITQPLPDQAQTGEKSAGERQEDAVSIWKGVFHTPPPAAEEPLKKETAESLLRSLIAKNEPAHKNVIFILAVMLERRRILVERDVQTRDDGSLIRVYERRGTGETIVVTDPHLDLNQLGQVQEEVLAMLGGKTEAVPLEAAGLAAVHSTTESRVTQDKHAENAK